MSSQASALENVGHGHVYPRPDGVKARCGGPAICAECARAAARKAIDERREANRQQEAVTSNQQLIADIEQMIHVMNRKETRLLDIVPLFDRCIKALQVETTAFQQRVAIWAQKCFWRPDALAPPQRAFRFIEEALELVQAMGTSREDVLRLVDYVYGRPRGQAEQEIGGVMVTAAALASAIGADLNACAETELSRCIANTERIREKDLAKPQRSPLPGLSQGTTAHDSRPLCANCDQPYSMHGKGTLACTSGRDGVYRPQTPGSAS